MRIRSKVNLDNRVESEGGESDRIGSNYSEAEAEMSDCSSNSPRIFGFNNPCLNLERCMINSLTLILIEFYASNNSNRQSYKQNLKKSQYSKLDTFKHPLLDTSSLIDAKGRNPDKEEKTKVSRQVSPVRQERCFVRIHF